MHDGSAAMAEAMLANHRSARQMSGDPDLSCAKYRMILQPRTTGRIS
jgi:hypothetical protein